MKNYVALIMLIGIFVVVLSGIGSSAACNTTDNIINSTSFSIGCTLDVAGTYTMSGEVFYQNSSNGWGIKIVSDNIVLNGNNSKLYGNYSKNGGVVEGIRIIGVNNTIIYNLTLIDWYKGLDIRNSSGTLDGLYFTDNYQGIQLYNGGFWNGSIIRNSGFNNNTYRNIRVWTDTMYNLTILNNNFNISQAVLGIWEETTSTSDGIIIDGNTFNQINVATTSIRQSNGGNWTIKNNNHIGSGLIYSYGFDIRGRDNIITNNTIRNTQYNINLQYAKNTLVNNNNLINGDEGSVIFGANNITITNNSFINMTQNYDEYNVGLSVKNSTNIIISYNNISEYGTVGIILQGTKNVTINNNYINVIPINLRTNYKARSYFDPICAIQSSIRYESYLPEWGNDNTTLLNNIISEGCLLTTQNQTKLNQDFTNYWYRSFQNLDGFMGKSELFISNNQLNVSRFYPSVNYTLLYARGNVTYIQYEVFKSYLKIKAINNTFTGTNAVFNLTSPRIYNSTLSSGTIITNNEANLTLQPNKEVYIGDASWS